MNKLMVPTKFIFFFLCYSFLMAPLSEVYCQGKNENPSSPTGQFNPLFDEFEKEIERFFKRFKGMDEDFMDDFFNGDEGPPFGSLFGKISRLGKWEETKDKIIFKIKGDLVKDQPLDIKIQDGKLLISGTFMAQSPRGVKHKSPMKVNKTLPIPGNADPETLKVEQKNGQVIIMFNRKDHSYKPGPRKLFPIRPPGGKQI